MKKNTQKRPTPTKEELLQLLEELQAQLTQAQEKEKRVLADYQNLVRRTQEERVKVFKLANKDLLLRFLQPFQHLEMAAGQLQDNGLTMVVQQFEQALSEFGVEEIKALGKEFDVETMEAIEKKGSGKMVREVVQKGYTLDGEVIQHAKVILGE